MLQKEQVVIYSGGQTGVDRAAIDFAIENRLKYTGYIPKGRKAEDGTISNNYRDLIELDTADYAERT